MGSDKDVRIESSSASAKPTTEWTQDGSDRRRRGVVQTELTSVVTTTQTTQKPMTQTLIESNVDEAMLKD